MVYYAQVYSQEDTSKMPLELANALSHERESVDDPEIRKQALEAIYLISLQVKIPILHILCMHLNDHFIFPFCTVYIWLLDIIFKRNLLCCRSSSVMV